MISVRELTKIYIPPGEKKAKRWLRRAASADERRPAADQVSFDVKRGELFVIMGLSGSGKSTVLRMLNRLVEPTSGAVEVDGTDLVSAAPRDLRRIRNSTINMVFQHFAIFPHRTVLENAAYGLQVRGVDVKERTARATAALERVGLGDWSHVLPSSLSGGMRQRVGLARALATDAEVLLMDEPYSALDPLIRRDMQDLLLELQEQLRKTIVFVTHDLNEAMRLGDRIMVMRDGKVIQVGTGSEILSCPADDYVADFVSDVDRSRVVTAETVMQEPLITVGPDHHPADALEKVANAEAHGAYVVTGDGTLVGAISVERLATATKSGVTSLQGLDLTEFKTVEEGTRLMDLMPLVGTCSVPLGVVDKSRRLIGVIPRAALLKALAHEGSTSHA
ncbi:glycine betaine/L-proline ABC transporter ATP-binding protein [Kribbella sp. NPDC050124]|uniref:glycine betaine/L-proline ABC transporter ATP-binding protein n=1 Tax=Kribbella sp. NPDC050124 TaxID=3364114 RepID=UPI0037AFFAD6